MLLSDELADDRCLPAIKISKRLVGTLRDRCNDDSWVSNSHFAT